MNQAAQLPSKANALHVDGIGFDEAGGRHLCGPEASWMELNGFAGADGH
jgi:hypothetical protein